MAALRVAQCTWVHAAVRLVELIAYDTRKTSHDVMLMEALHKLDGCQRLFKTCAPLERAAASGTMFAQKRLLVSSVLLTSC